MWILVWDTGWSFGVAKLKSLSLLSPHQGGMPLKVLTHIDPPALCLSISTSSLTRMEHKDIVQVIFQGTLGKKVRNMWVLVNALSMETNASCQQRGGL